MSPTPNTTFFRVAARCGHFWQTEARARNSAMAACFAWGSSGAAPGGAGADDSARVGAHGATLASPRRVEGGGPAGARLGAEVAALGSRTRDGSNPANVSWDTVMNLTPCAFWSSRCRTVAS